LLFDGRSTAKWKMSTIANQPGRDDPGRFHVVDAGLESAPGTDLGLFYTKIDFVNYILRLEWLAWRDDDNSGVFLRFPDPASPDIHYDNRAFIGVDFGFEVQIDALGRGSPPPGQNVDKKFRTTGAIYNIANQTLDESVLANGAGQWNRYEIRQGQTFTVFLNGKRRRIFNLTRHAARPMPDPFHWAADPHRTGAVSRSRSRGCRRPLSERCRTWRLLRAKLADAKHGAFAVRILHLTTEFPPIIYGGLGTATGGLVRALAKGGIETAVFLFGPSSGGSYGQFRPFASGTAAKRRRALGATIFEVSWFLDPATIAAIAAKWRPDVLHLHSFWIWPIAENLSPLDPLVYTVHSLIAPNTKSGRPSQCMNQWGTAAVVHGRIVSPPNQLAASY
jgi:hypothetical protein